MSVTEPFNSCLLCAGLLSARDARYRIRQAVQRLTAEGCEQAAKPTDDWLCARCSLQFDLTQIEQFLPRASFGRLKCGRCQAEIRVGEEFMTLSISRHALDSQAEPMFTADACQRCRQLYAELGMQLTPNREMVLRCHFCGRDRPAADIVEIEAPGDRVPRDPYGLLQPGKAFCCQECLHH